jgi:hypothetical protein
LHFSVARLAFITSVSGGECARLACALWFRDEAWEASRPFRAVSFCGFRMCALEPVQNLLRVGPAALKTGSECSFTISKLRFLPCFCLAWL